MLREKLNKIVPPPVKRLVATGVVLTGLGLSGIVGCGAPQNVQTPSQNSTIETTKISSSRTEQLTTKSIEDICDAIENADIVVSSPAPSMYDKPKPKYCSGFISSLPYPEDLTVIVHPNGTRETFPAAYKIDERRQTLIIPNHAKELQSYIIRKEEDHQEIKPDSLQIILHDVRGNFTAMNPLSMINPSFSVKGNALMDDANINLFLNSEGVRGDLITKVTEHHFFGDRTHQITLPFDYTKENFSPEMAAEVKRMIDLLKNREEKVSSLEQELQREQQHRLMPLIEERERVCKKAVNVGRNAVKMFEKYLRETNVVVVHSPCNGDDIYFMKTPSGNVVHGLANDGKVYQKDNNYVDGLFYIRVGGCESLPRTQIYMHTNAITGEGDIEYGGKLVGDFSFKTPYQGREFDTEIGMYRRQDESGIDMVIDGHEVTAILGAYPSTLRAIHRRAIKMKSDRVDLNEKMADYVLTHFE